MRARAARHPGGRLWLLVAADFASSRGSGFARMGVSDCRAVAAGTGGQGGHKVFMAPPGHSSRDVQAAGCSPRACLCAGRGRPSLRLLPPDRVRGRHRPLGAGSLGAGAACAARQTRGGSTSRVSSFARPPTGVPCLTAKRTPSVPYGQRSRCRDASLRHVQLESAVAPELADANRNRARRIALAARIPEFLHRLTTMDEVAPEMQDPRGCGP